MKEIESKKVNLSNLLVSNENRYLIPDFQRAYVWNTIQASELMNDFIVDTENFTKDPDNQDDYLLGNIVIIEKEEEKVCHVIDGQQRMTTITLLFRILYLKHKELIKNGDLNDDFSISMSSNLLNGYTKSNYNGTHFTNKLFHHESLNFGKTYRTLMDNEQTSIEDDETSSDKNIREVYETLSEYVETLDIDQHLKFIYYLQNKVSIILTTAPDLSKAFQLFEILNARGVSLEAIDLIKNYFLKKLSDLNSTEDQKNEFKKNWTDFLDNLHYSKRSSIPEGQFLKHYIIGTRGINVKNEQMYLKFSKEFFINTTVDEILEFSKDIRKKSKTYTEIAYKADNNFTDNKDKLIYMIDVLGVKQLFFLLIPFYNESEENKEEILDLAIKLGSSVLFSFTQTNFLEKELPNLIEKYLTVSKTDKPKAYNDFKYNLERIIKEKAEIARDALRTRKFEKGNTSKPISKVEKILKFIEFYGMNKENVLNKKINNKKITIEHILSVKLNPALYTKYGFTDAEDYKSNLNRIGNLTLLLFDSNISASNKCPEDKSNHYLQSEFNLTQKLANDIQFSVQTGERKELIDNFNTTFTSYLENNGTSTFNKAAVESRSNEIAEYVYNLLK